MRLLTDAKSNTQKNTIRHMQITNTEHTDAHNTHTNKRSQCVSVCVTSTYI